MKKLGIGIGVVAIILVGVFMWLVSGASADNAPKDTVVIDLPDTYER